MTSVPPAENPPPVGVDPTRPSVARAYDAALGGKDNYEVDRKLVEEVKKFFPEAFDLAFAGRNFLIRVARYMAGDVGISQFIDCGSGLPTAENTHQVAQRVNPDARVVYLDNDPVVLAHGRALLADNEMSFLAGADIFDPPQVLENEEVKRHIDFSEPIGLLLISVLHHYAGPREGPAAIMREYIDALPSGSYVGLTHLLEPENEHTELVRKLEHKMQESFGAGAARTKPEIEALFAGLEMVPPGVVLCGDWYPDGPRVTSPSPAHYLLAGGVGRKP